MSERSSVSPSLPPFHTFTSLCFSHADGCVVISHCHLHLYFSSRLVSWISSQVLICHLYILFGERSSPVFYHFQIGLFLTVEFWELALWRVFLVRSVVCEYFLSVGSLSFNHVSKVFCRVQVFNWKKSHWLIFFLSGIVFLVSCLRTLCLTLCPKDFLVFFSCKFYNFTLYF